MNKVPTQSDVVVVGAGPHGMFFYSFSLISKIIITCHKLKDCQWLYDGSKVYFIDN